MTWLNEDLKSDIKNIFQPRYQRALNDDEIEAIAVNLTNLMESYLRFKWRAKNEKEFSY